MKQILKYPLKKIALRQFESSYLMPKGAEVLTVQTQDGMPFIFALVDPNAEMEEKYFQVLETGDITGCRYEKRHFGSFQEERIIEMEKQPDILNMSLEEHFFPPQKTSKKEYLVFHVFEVLD